MRMSKTEKILLSLLLCGGLVSCAHAELEYTTIEISEEIVTVIYSDAEGNEQMYESMSELAVPDTASLNVEYSSPNGGSNTVYYAWTDDGFVQVTGASSADVIAKWTTNAEYPDGLYNDGTDESLQGKDIAADFVNDHHDYEGGDGNLGGAIENRAREADATLGTITGNFIGNSESSSLNSADGGAIFNYAQNGYSAVIGNITGNFIGNGVDDSSTDTSHNNSDGGAIFNEASSSTAKIGDITGDFVGNTAKDEGEDGSPTAAGGAIYNYTYGENAIAEIGNITGNFYGNSAQGTKAANSRGGAISNDAGDDSGSGDVASIGNITGDFIGNYATSESRAAWGGAILNMATENQGTATIGNLTGNFVSNYVLAGRNAFGGAIHNRAGGSGNTTTATIGNITGDFLGNYAESTGDSSYGAWGGAIANYVIEDSTASHTAEIGSITGNFAYNYVSAAGNAEGGAIFNGFAADAAGTASIDGITEANFFGNYAESAGADAYGGAIFNNGTITAITNSFFEDNSASSESGEGCGGAIYNAGEIGTITNTSFVDNSASTNGGAIYTTTDLTIAADGADVIFVGNTVNEESNAIYMASDADGDATTVKFELSNGGSIAMYDAIAGDDGYGVEISGDGLDTTFYLLNDVEGADLSVGSTTLSTTMNTSSDVAHTYSMSSFTLTGDINMAVDVDLANEKMDKISAESYGDHAGTLTVSGMNLISDAKSDSVEIVFAEDGLKDNVESSVNVAYAPVYQYSLTYDDRDDAGYFVFDKAGYNPAVMANSIAQMGVFNAMGLMFEYNFEHSDYYAKLPEDVRLAMGKSVKRAPKESDPTRAAYYNGNELTERGVWMRSFASNESVSYRGGWGSRDKYYGAMVGFDSKVRVSENGWANVTTGYAGTLGIRQEYSGGHIKQHGGFVGVTESFYKKNFYTAWTIAAGTTKAHEHTMYGHDKTRLDNYGIAARFGYNFDLAGGKFSLLPTFTASYSTINPEDFTSAGGTEMSGSGFRAVQLNPNVKFIMNMKNGLQPYLTVGEVWTVGESWGAKADGYKLDELELKPYTEYGVGLQKRWTNQRDAYVQFMGHSHGRDGFLVNAGMRWNF